MVEIIIYKVASLQLIGISATIIRSAWGVDKNVKVLRICTPT